jgi:Methyltransferase domain
MEDSEPYAKPLLVESIDDCYFYHKMDLPGQGVVGGEWDLRGREAAYLGNAPLRGKRVLELGTASGALCRYMNDQGADVIGFDLSPAHSWDLVPFAKFDIKALADQNRDHIRRLNNAWWFVHRVCGLRAKLVHGTVHDIPDSIGLVDVSTACAILLHLRDPFQALANAARLTKETLIVTEVHPEQPEGSGLGTTVPPQARSPHPGAVYFMPNYVTNDPGGAWAWWSLPPSAICQFLGALGFEDMTVSDHLQTFMDKPTRLFTVVGNRTQPRR